MTRETLTRAVRLAKFHTQPLEYVHVAHIADIGSGLSREDISSFSAHPAFAGPMNRAMSKALELALPTLQQHDVAALETNETAKCLFDLVTASRDRFGRFLNSVAAVRLHGAILKCVLKSDRQKIQALFGERAFNLAVREAPLTYPALNFDLGSARLLDEIANADAVHEIGAVFVRNFVRVEQPALLRLLDLRLPGQVSRGTDDLGDAEIAAFRRFLRDRVTQ